MSKEYRISVLSSDKCKPGEILFPKNSEKMPEGNTVRVKHCLNKTEADLTAVGLSDYDGLFQMNIDDLTKLNADCIFDVLVINYKEEK